MSNAQANGIEVAFWDFGGVFTGSPFGPGNAAYAESLGTTLDVVTDLVFGYHTPDGDHPWHRVERGELKLSDGFKAVAAQVADAGIEGFDLQQFFKAMSSKGEPTVSAEAVEDSSSDFNPGEGLAKATARPEMVQLVRDLRTASVRNCIITNNVKEFASSWKQMLPLELFDDIIDSSDVGLRKPDPAIYQLALERMDSPSPQATVFLDDFQGNLDSAAAMGINTVLVPPEPAAAISAVRALTGVTG